MDNKREQIWKSLNEPEYRHQFVEEEINVGIAFQIRSLRNRQNLTQVNLANKLKVRQPLVSAWEDPNYGTYSLKTLKDLAKAFDVGLLVRFVPFSTLVDWTVNLSQDTIAPPSFGEENHHFNNITLFSTVSHPKESIPFMDANSVLYPDRSPYIFASTVKTEKELVHA